MQPAGKMYLVDPSPSSADLMPEQRKLILGGEVAMWAEQFNERTMDSRIWPRAAAIAERFWSPEKVVDVDDMYRRLDKVSVELESIGLRHLSQEDIGLRELAGTEDIVALRKFAAVLEPVSFGERYQEQHTSQLTVLDRFVDAVRPDPPSRHAIDLLTRGLLKTPSDAADRQGLERWFHEMSESAPAVEAQMAGSPRLADVATRAHQLPMLAKVGLEAVQYVSTGQKAPAGWKANATALIEEAKKPSAIVRFTFVDSLTALVTAVKE